LTGGGTEKRKKKVIKEYLDREKKRGWEKRTPKENGRDLRGIKVRGRSKDQKGQG